MFGTSASFKSTFVVQLTEAESAEREGWVYRMRMGRDTNPGTPATALQSVHL